MAEYINQEALAADGWYLQRHIYREGTVYVENMNLLDVPTTSVVPMVLCRDCVNYGEMLSGYDHRLICHKFALTTKPNDFCSRGERRNCG